MYVIDNKEDKRYQRTIDNSDIMGSPNVYYIINSKVGSRMGEESTHAHTLMEITCSCGRSGEQAHCVRCGSYYLNAYARVKDEPRKYRCRRCDERFSERDKCHATNWGVKRAEHPTEQNSAPTYDMYSDIPSLQELLNRAERSKP